MKHKITTFIFGLIGLILCFAFWNTSFFWYLIIPYLSIYIAIVGLGSYFIHWNYHIKSISSVDSEGIVLTFDDGPHPRYTPEILKILDQFNIKAVFFMIGKEVEKYPDLVREVVRRGHVVGNHSHNHSNMISFFRAKKLMADFKKSQTTIVKTIGFLPMLIRPPFGATNPMYFKFLRETGLTSLGWKVRSFDTKETKPVEFINNTIEKITQNKGALCLFHDTQELTVETLPKIIEGVLSKGMEIVSLTDVSNINVYEKS